MGPGGEDAIDRGSLSVVVPVRDPRRVEWGRCRQLAGVPGVGEVLVVAPTGAPGSGHEPWSPDATTGHEVGVAVRVLSAPLGRASQMNAGARAARGEFVLFLHADTGLEPAALTDLLHALRANPARAFTFGLGFASGRFRYRVLSRLAALRDRVWPFPLGDQGLALARASFLNAGGFADEPLFEDARMTLALRKAGRLRVLSTRVQTSPARFERLGLARALGANALLLGLFLLGRSPRGLVRHYYGAPYLDRWLAADPARSASEPGASTRKRAIRTGGEVRGALRGLLLSIVLALTLTGAARGVDHTHALLDSVLTARVDDGLVDYRALVADDADPESAFSRYLVDLGTGSTEEESRWSREERLAYWINAYNAFTLKLIVDHYPIQARWYTFVFPPVRRWMPANSILQIPGRWDEVTFPSVRGPITLGAIEHEILRPEFGDPRIHFAIVCASIGCPVLRSTAFRPEGLDLDLDDATTDFVSDPGKVTLDDDGERLRVSEIFKWFQEDFDVAVPSGREVDPGSWEGYGDDAGVVRWIAAYAPAAVRNTLQSEILRVDTLRYDWNLNEQPETDGQESGSEPG